MIRLVLEMHTGAWGLGSGLHTLLPFYSVHNIHPHDLCPAAMENDQVTQ
jgi:hypothetical protein